MDLQSQWPSRAAKWQFPPLVFAFFLKNGNSGYGILLFRLPKQQNSNFGTLFLPLFPEIAIQGTVFCHGSAPNDTARRIGHFLTLHVRTLFRSYEVPFLDCGECGKKADRDDVRHFVLCRFILSASFSVKAAGGTGREVFRQEFFSVEADSAFLSQEAWYPYGPACFDAAEGRG